MNEKTYTIAVTGHRPPKIGGYEDNPLRDKLKEQYVIFIKSEKAKHENLVFFSGMALGVDQDFAEVALKEKVSFIAVVPFEDFYAKWPVKSQQKYLQLLKKAQNVITLSTESYSVELLQKRNEYMVDNADEVYAVYDGSTGGTANCVNYAQQKNKKVTIIDPYDFRGKSEKLVENQQWSKEKKLKFFARELGYIRDPEIKTVVEEILALAPEYFWIAPASSSGKYHPSWAAGESGLLRHTKAVVFFGRELIRAMQLEAENDFIIAALIVHDTAKDGLPYDVKDKDKRVILATKHPSYSKEHPLLVRHGLSRKRFGGFISFEKYSKIMDLVEFHMGQWTPKPFLKPMAEFTPSQVCVHLSDYLASRPEIALSKGILYD